MCTFDGILREYPWISVDSFLEKSCQSARVFFISHIHTDHLRGLDQSLFSDYVRNNRRTRIYCSDTTRSFLARLPAYKHLSSNYYVVNVNQPMHIQHPDDENSSVTVTCFGSGHCPGSLMLLFEGSHGNVLYTGDFRLYAHQSNRYRVALLKKRIDSLYIDMTFFEPSIRCLPEREQSCQVLIDFIEQTMDRFIYLKTSARVGYEYVYLALYRHFGLSIHVTPEQYQLYDCLPQVQRVLTINGPSTRLHACWPRCSETKSSIKIVLSVLWFTLQQQQSFKSPLVQISENYYRLCYSLHSSYNEICTFLRHLSPNQVHPIALPDQVTSERFDELLQQFGIRSAITTVLSSSPCQLQLKRRYECISPNKGDDDGLNFHCHGQDEKELFQRMNDLRRSPVKRLKSDTNVLHPD